MKGHEVVQCYFPWTAQRYYNQVLAFTEIKKKLAQRLAFCFERRQSVLSIDQVKLILVFMLANLQ